MYAERSSSAAMVAYAQTKQLINPVHVLEKETVYMKNNGN